MTIIDPKLVPIYKQAFNAKSFLNSIESVIHVEVHKMYENAYTPTFDYQDTGENELVIRYKSKRKLYALMEGLIIGVGEHFNCTINQRIETVNLDSGEEVADFHLAFS